MPPIKGNIKSTRKPKSGIADMTSSADNDSEMASAATSAAEHESDVTSGASSATERDVTMGEASPNRKKKKALKRKSVLTEPVAVAVATEKLMPAPSRKPKTAVSFVAGGLLSVITEMNSISSAISSAVVVNGVDSTISLRVIGETRRYEALVMTLMDKIARLEERVQLGVGCRSEAMPPPLAVPTAVLPKPTETWSVVVKSKDPKVTPQEVVGKVLTQVAPTLGVRVHEVKAVKNGGAIIRTPSVGERNRISANEKFAEVGLDVTVNQERGSKLVIQGVHSEISVDEFMAELYELNLKEYMSPALFKTNVRIASKPWSPENGASVNVTLELDEAIAAKITSRGKCYIKWFSFRVITARPMLGCFRCFSFDHRIAECRLKEDVCARCGENGHRGRDCVNQMRCRNCAFKGKPSNHLMMSTECPIYAGIVARANARH